MINNYIVLTALFFLFGMIRYKKIINPYAMFNILCVLVLILISKGHKNIDTPSDEAMECFYAGIIGFNISFLIPTAKFTVGKMEQWYKKAYKIDFLTAKKVSYFMVVVGIFAATEPFIKILTGTPLTQIRTDYYSYTGVFQYLWWYFRLYTFMAAKEVLFIVALYGILYKCTYANILMRNSIICLFLDVISSGGRLTLLNALFIIMGIYFAYKEKFHFSWRQKIAVFLISILIGYFIIYVTNLRSTFLMRDMSTTERIFDTIYQYFAGSLTYLGRVISSHSDVMGTTHGLTVFQGFFAPIFVLLNFIGIQSPRFINLMGDLTYESIVIGQGYHFNALPTAFAYFYLDGRIPFTVIGCCIFGYICKCIFYEGSKGDLFCEMAYYLILIQILNMTTRWLFYQSDFCGAFIYLLLFLKAEIIDDESNQKSTSPIHY